MEPLKPWFTAFIAVVFTLFSPAPAKAAGPPIELLYPADQVSTTISTIQLIGRCPPKSRLGLQIKNNGQTRKTVPVVTGNAFSQTVALSPGLNTLAVLDRTGAVVASREIYLLTTEATQAPDNFTPYFLHNPRLPLDKCDGCHPAGRNGAIVFRHLEQTLTCTSTSCHPRIGKARFLHGPLEEGQCVGCHNPHGSRHVNFLKAVRGELCYSCHETEKIDFQQKVQHFPVKKGECLSCHDPHQSNQEFHLKRGSIVELCAGCHGKVMTSHKVMHEPVKEGDCIACHNPHASEYQNLLYEQGSKLCFTCHTLRKEEFQRRHVHEPVKKNCALCHDPHGSGTVYHLRTITDRKGRYIKVKQPLKETCLRCHRKLNPKVAAEVENAPVKHKPVEEGRCTVCHTPHSTNYPKQLKAPLAKICFSCHKKMKKRLARKKYLHGPVRNSDCAQCHQVHGSRYPYLLAANFIPELYSDFDPENYRLCFNCHNEEIFTNDLNQDTGFRNGSQNLHYLHVNRKKGRSCATCHDVHGANQKFHIRRKIPYRKKFTISLKYTKTANGGGCVVGCHKPRKYDRELPVKNR